MNKCFWRKVLQWAWGGAKEFAEYVVAMIVLALFFGAMVGIAYAAWCPLPGVDPMIVGIVFLLRLLLIFLLIVMFIKSCVFDVGRKLRQFKKECE